MSERMKSQAKGARQPAARFIPQTGDYGEVFEARAENILRVAAIPGCEVRADDVLV